MMDWRKDPEKVLDFVSGLEPAPPAEQEVSAAAAMFMVLDDVYGSDCSCDACQRLRVIAQALRGEH